MVRVGSRWKLIDLDSCVRIDKELLPHKCSTGYAAPELHKAIHRAKKIGETNRSNLASGVHETMAMGTTMPMLAMMKWQ